MHQSAVQAWTVQELARRHILGPAFLQFRPGGRHFLAQPGADLLHARRKRICSAGPVYLLMMAKVQKRWAATILGAVCASFGL